MREKKPSHLVRSRLIAALFALSCVLALPGSYYGDVEIEALRTE